LMKRPLPDDFDLTEGPTGPGWVIQLRGYHYYNSPKRMGREGSAHVRRFLTTNLLEKEITVPLPNGQLVTFTPQEMGLSYPLQLDENKPEPSQIPNPDFDPQKAALARTTARSAAELDGENIEQPFLKVDRLDFVFQVVWQESTLSDRLEAKRLKEQEKEEQRALEAQSGTGDAVAMNP